MKRDSILVNSKVSKLTKILELKRMRRKLENRKDRKSSQKMDPLMNSQKKKFLRNQ